ncbi:MAG: sirohydrochlorin chelatase [Bacilli bacterium]
MGTGMDVHAAPCGGPTDSAVLFVGHGTRAECGVAEFYAFTDAVKGVLRREGGCDRSARTIFADCFLELCEPDIAMGIRSCREQGATHIWVQPVFLFAAGHVRRDIPREVTRAQTQGTNLAIRCGDALNENPGCIALACVRLAEAGFQAHGAGDAAVVVLGRGSGMPGAVRRFQAVVEQIRIHLGGAARVEAAVLTGSGASLEECLGRCAAAGAGQIYVLPYLLFSGRLTAKLPQRIAGWREACRVSASVVATAHLGAHPLLVDQVTERVRHGLTCLRAVAASQSSHR